MLTARDFTAFGRLRVDCGVTKSLRGVVFDLDGTLVDSWSLHVTCLRSAVAAVGGRCPSATTVLAAQRPTDVATVARLVEPDRFDEAWSAYRRTWRNSLHTKPIPAVPGALAVVEVLRRCGLALGICTGRSREDAQLLLDTSGITIDLTVAREDARQPKPAPDGLLQALRAHGLRTSEALYVGDSSTDVTQGRAAGVETVLVDARGGSNRSPTSERRITRLDQLFGHLTWS